MSFKRNIPLKYAIWRYYGIQFRGLDNQAISNT